MIGSAVVLLAVAVGLFAVAAWFGMVVIAPRLGRAMDQAEEREEPGDRPD